MIAPKVRIPTMLTPADLAQAIHDSTVEIAYWKQRRAQAANPVDRAEAGARLLLWEGNRAAKRIQLKEMGGRVCA